MKKCWLISSILLFAVGLSGCKSQVEEPPPGDPPPEPHSLRDTIDIKLSDWLDLPRAKLAEMADDAEDRLRTALTSNRDDKSTVPLLPQVRMPLTIPVLHKAKYSQALGFSLPPYLKEGQKDAALALHLARHGDVEAGLKLANSEDRQLLEQIEACRRPRNYPVEWTRLVALTLEEAELKLTIGEVDGASDLVLLQKQLRDLLDPKSAAGPLGANLLPVGGRALRDSAEAWRKPGVNQTFLADQIQQALKEWGDLPAQEPSLKPGASRAVASQFFTDGGSGQVLTAHSTNGLRRLLDLQNMPLVDEGVVGAVAFFDARGLLSEVWYVYGDKTTELFHETTNLAHHLIEQNATGGPIEKVEGMFQQSYSAGSLRYQFTMTPPRIRALGALLRVVDAKSRPASCRLPVNALDLGPVNLYRTYERTREELAPDTTFGKPLEFDQADFLSGLKVPLGDARPALASLAKVKNADLFDSLTLRWHSSDRMSIRAWPSLLLPLWGAYGPCRLETGDHNLNLVWEEGTTRITLLVPFDDVDSPDLILSDTRGSREEAERLKTATALDQQARKQRLDSDKALLRLPRFLQWSALTLGMSREQASKELPHELRSRPLIKTTDGSFSMLFSGTLATATATPLQLVLRFTPDDKLAQIRIRYKEGPLKISATAPALLDRLKKSNGAPEVLPAPWLGLWTDMPTEKTNPVYYRWRDDRTTLTYQGDRTCMEVVLTDCPPDQPEGVSLPKLEICSRGDLGCQLGESKEDLLKRWKPSSTSVMADGSLVLFPPARSPYDLYLVSFENGKVSQIMGRYRNVPVSRNEDFSAELNNVWGADADHLGVVRLVNQNVHPETGQMVVHGYNWHDDRTRIHAFIKRTREGKRMWTEWRDWPIPAKPAAPANGKGEPGKKTPSRGTL